MSIYKGSQKQGTIYKGSTKIGKVYKGNQLLYEGRSGIKLYVANYYETSDSNYTYYSIDGLIGSWSTDGYVVTFEYKTKNKSGTITPRAKILQITGSLGASGSKVQTDGSGNNSLEATLVINGKTCYVYKGSGMLDPTIFILKDSVKNNYAINNLPYYATSSGTGASYAHPTSVTNNSYTYKSYGRTYTVNRTTNDVIVFTKETGAL